jgi:hypothetical protein
MILFYYSYCDYDCYKIITLPDSLSYYKILISKKTTLIIQIDKLDKLDKL